ncbi:MAG: hypothetical protein J6A69_11195 [Clostridia bacterium]|nr:hypothetical protein [Clostridia bacterium]
MKFKKMLSCFVSFFLICCNLVVSTCSATIPTSLPIFKFSYSFDFSKEYVPWCYILSYNQSKNVYRLDCFTNTFEYYNQNYIVAEYDIDLSCFCIYRGNQTHISYSSSNLYRFTQISKDNSVTPPVYSFKNEYSSVCLNYPKNSSYKSDFIFPDIDNFNSSSSGFEVIACNRDIVAYDSSGVSLSGANFVTIFKGDENYLNSFFADGYKPVYPSFEYQPVTQPSTEPASSSSSGDNTEQVKTSKNILENVKNLLKSIGNLPGKVFDAFSSVLSSIAQGISDLVTFSTDFFINFFSRLADALKNIFVTLFVPDDDGILSEIKDIITTKFGFFSQFVSFGETLINSNFGKEEPKSFSFTLYGNTWNLIDWSVVAPYRSTIRTITIIVNYYWFIQKTIKRIPGIIGGITSE